MQIGTILSKNKEVTLGGKKKNPRAIFGNH